MNKVVPEVQKLYIDQRLKEAVYDAILGDTTEIKNEDLAIKLMGYELAKCRSCGNSVQIPIEYDDPVTEFFAFMSEPENFAFTCKWLFNVNIIPLQLLILQELWRFVNQNCCLNIWRRSGRTHQSSEA